MSVRQLNELIHEKKDLKRALEVFQVDMKEECVHQHQPHFRKLAGSSNISYS
jgi:hypothetical protein